MTTYHRGERAVQRRAGVLDRADHTLRAVRTSVPDVAADFLARQPVLFLGAADDRGRLWGTALAGEPGFLRVPDGRTVEVAATPAAADPLAGVLAGPAAVGAIAVEPGTRRRMRVNGTARPRDGGLVVAVEQVVANCPKYIQQRVPERVPGAAEPRVTGRGVALTAAQQVWVRAADTFFVTTASDEGDVDTSHRGGNPGFVRVRSGTELEWPDYAGNAMFLTLGNLDVNPAAGLLFCDWATGATLHVSGRARVDWSADRAADHPGAERVVLFTVTDVVEVAGLVPLRWGEPGYSRFNPPLG
ncbi:pyridoxamine 5'-phosphate oxidase family protein [Saccharothrix syringae]|uniref:Pyridoxamine 5'-phosphate oxidase family protein n=1 Tax=Saccharothrix syringae TaxID=103733 RepID=A0A5Q0H5N3_SACSY|nr:pyridoxamine 5'-phosphate oxidase family protein [Saccharothrix syringae]QFZ21497.1 pyridoxamine 5'-phosphate oxidase family protein [Saccharothrix syringae]